MLRLLSGYLRSRGMIALPAHGLIHVLAANHLCYMFRGCANVETGSEVAPLADSLQFLHFLAFGHKLDDRVKHGSHASRVKGRHYHHFSFVSCILAPYGFL